VWVQTKAIGKKESSPYAFESFVFMNRFFSHCAGRKYFWKFSIQFALKKNLTKTSMIKLKAQIILLQKAFLYFMHFHLSFTIIDLGMKRLKGFLAY
jgi:hypothetical protein